jgi:hypothetical protein
MYARAKAMLKYASKPDGYIRGFPESNMVVLEVAPADIEAALTRAVGSWDSISSSILGRGSEQFLLNRGLQELYPNLSWPNGAPATAWDENAATFAIPVVNPDTGNYYQSTSWDYALLSGAVLGPQEIEEDDWITVDWDEQFANKYRITFNYTDNAGAEQTYVVSSLVDLSEYLGPSAPPLVQIKYVVGGQTFYWIYVVGSGLDSVFEAQIGVDIRYGQYLPVAVLMQDKVWFDSNPDSLLAKTTNKLLKKLATSGTDIREDFEEQEAEDNASGEGDKSNAEKWDFFVHFAVPIRTKARGGLEYLFHYFRQLETWQQFTRTHYTDYLASGGVSAQPINELTIKEAGNNGYNVSYRWSYCSSLTRPGVWQVEETNPLALDFGNIRDMRPGEYTSHLVRRTDGYTNEAEYREQIEEMFGPGIDIGDFDENADEENHDYVIITRQEKVAEGDPAEYTRVIMMAPSMEYTINTAVDGDYRFRYAQPEIWDDEADPENEGKEFRFPIHAASLLEVSRMHREEALQEGLTATVFLVQVIKVKWYQTGFFKWLIIIIAIVLIYYLITIGMYEMAIHVAGWVGASSAFAIFLIYVVLSFSVGYVLTLAASLIGGTAGQIFAIIAMVAMMYGTAGHGEGGFSWTGNETEGFAQALKFIQNVNSLIAQPFYAVMNVYNSHKLEGEIEDFAAERREKLQELKDAYDGLGEWPDGLDPWDIIVTFVNPSANETPESFIGRTTDPNPGMKALDLVLHWPDLCMMPPRPGETSIPEGVFVDLARQRGAA